MCGGTHCTSRVVLGRVTSRYLLSNVKLRAPCGIDCKGTLVETDTTTTTTTTPTTTTNNKIATRYRYYRDGGVRRNMWRMQKIIIIIIVEKKNWPTIERRRAAGHQYCGVRTVVVRPCGAYVTYTVRPYIKNAILFTCRSPPFGRRRLADGKRDGPPVCRAVLPRRTALNHRTTTGFNGCRARDYNLLRRRVRR